MLKPAGYRLLIEVEEVKETTTGGIILAQQTIDADAAAQTTGRVLAIGEFAFKEYPARWCNVGDTVTFAKYLGVVQVDPGSGKKYRVCNDIDILCIVKPEPVANA
jgi:co-chaperonin GroES (HSP10)